MTCIVISSTDAAFHQTFLRRDEQPPFPRIFADEKYWANLSERPVFRGKAPKDLLWQTVALLYALLSFPSIGREPPHHIPNLSQDFLPLQNLCLYFEAFTIEEHPLGAFRPLDEAGFASALRMSGVFPGDTEPHNMKHLDCWLRECLPINCPRFELVSHPGASTKWL